MSATSAQNLLQLISVLGTMLLGISRGEQAGSLIQPHHHHHHHHPQQPLSHPSINHGHQWPTSSDDVSDEDVCKTDYCERSAFMLGKNMNMDFNPCENFFEYACGNMYSLHPRQPWKQNISYIGFREEAIQTKLQRFFRLADLRAYPNIRKLYSAYTQCMEYKPRGLEDISYHLKSVGLPVIPPFHDQASAQLDESTILAKIHRYSPTTTFLFDVNVQRDPQDITENHIYFGHTPRASNAPISAKDEVSSAFEASKAEIRQGLLKHILTTANFMYANLGIQLTYAQGSQRNTLANAVADFLLELDQVVHIDRYSLLEDVSFCLYVRFQSWTDQILQKGNIQINWDKYFKVLFENIAQPMDKGNPRNWKYIMIQSPNQMQEVLKILEKTSKDVFIGAMWYVVVRSMNEFVPAVLQDVNDEYERAVLKITNTPRDIKKKETCSKYLAHIASPIAGYIFAIYENGSKNRNLVMRIIEEVHSALQDLIQEASWLDGTTREKALKKLRNITYSIPFPDKQYNIMEIEKSFEGLTLESNYYLTYIKGMKNSRVKPLRFILTQNSFESRSTIASTPSSVDATYYQQYLHLTISTGFIGFPFFDRGLNVLDYSGIGTIIGHELGHAYEEAGLRYNSIGGYESWFSDSSRMKYVERKKCFIDLYGKSVLPFIHKHTNGVSTLSENIADSIGFAAALRAYRKIVAKFGMEQLLVYFEEFTYDQLFTLGFASIWCQNASPQHIIDKIENDRHSPAIMRVNGVMMNSKEFAKIWDCPAGSPMNPKSKCEIFS